MYEESRSIIKESSRIRLFFWICTTIEKLNKALPKRLQTALQKKKKKRYSKQIENQRPQLPSHCIMKKKMSHSFLGS